MDETATRTNAAGELVLPVLGTLPPLEGLGPWFNSPPLTNARTQGQGRADRFLDLQLHQLPPRASLFARHGTRSIARTGWSSSACTRPNSRSSANLANVAKAVEDLGVHYPVALDNEYAFWSALHNNTGRRITSSMRRAASASHHHGEGDYAMSERVIQQLLAEAGHAPSDRHGRRRARRAPKLPRRSARSARPRPTSAMPAPNASSRPAGCMHDSQRPMRPRRSRSMNGRSRAAGSTIAQSARSPRRARRSPSASTPATSISCWAPRTASRCASGDARRQGAWRRRRASTPSRTARASSRSSGSISSFARRARFATALSRSTFLDPGVQAFSFTFG